MRKSQLERFLSHIAEGKNDCLEWHGARNAKGYGFFRFGGRGTSQVKAHRFAYEQYVGPIGNKLVLHKCDNPACVNPDHLYLGTHADNMRDRRARGRTWSGDLEPKTVAKIRKLWWKWGWSQNEIGRKLKMNPNTVNGIATGVAYAHLPMPSCERPRRYRHKGQRLPFSLVSELRERYAPGGSKQRPRGKYGAAQLALIYDIPLAFVCRICYSKNAASPVSGE